MEKWLGGTARTWLAGAVAGGIVVGGAVGLLGFGDSGPDPATLALDAVPVYACPGAGAVGTLHRGDRVLITGRSGEWLAVRNVRGSGERVFVSVDVVTPDADLSGLPVEDCEDVGAVAVAPTTEGTTTTTVADTTTTSDGATTTTSSSTTTTTTTAPDTTAPSISAVTVSETEIWEQDQGPGLINCPPGTPRQTTISVTVTDPESGVASVVAAWTDPGGSHQVAMTRNGDVYSIVIGPYPEQTWENPSLAPFDHNLAIAIFAEDGEGNQSQTGTQITVWEIGECFG